MYVPKSLPKSDMGGQSYRPFCNSKKAKKVYFWPFCIKNDLYISETVIDMALFFHGPQITIKVLQILVKILIVNVNVN